MIVEHLASSYCQDLEQEVDRFLELVAEPEDTLRRVFQLLLMEEILHRLEYIHVYSL